MKNFFLPYSRWPGQKQRAALDLLQQRGRHQLPANALCAVRSPEAHHGAASGGREGGHRQPGPHRPGNNIHTAPHNKSPEKPTLMLSVTLLLLLLFTRFTAWKTRAASSPCRVTLEGSRPSTSTRSEFCFLFLK